MDSQPRGAMLSRENRRTSTTIHDSAVLPCHRRALRTTVAVSEGVMRRSCIAVSNRFCEEVRVGMEACGHYTWFERLLQELGIELWLGDAARVRASVQD